jgi:hypothetical protein
MSGLASAVLPTKWRILVSTFLVKLEILLVAVLTKIEDQNLVYFDNPAANSKSQPTNLPTFDETGEDLNSTFDRNWPSYDGYLMENRPMSDDHEINILGHSDNYEPMEIGTDLLLVHDNSQVSQSNFEVDFNSASHDSFQQSYTAWAQGSTNQIPWHPHSYSPRKQDLLSSTVLNLSNPKPPAEGNVKDTAIDLRAECHQIRTRTRSNSWDPNFNGELLPIFDFSTYKSAIRSRTNSEVSAKNEQTTPTLKVKICEPTPLHTPGAYLKEA